MLKRELWALCLLRLLSRPGEWYGYELLRSLHAVFPDAQESALYAVLRGLCGEGHIASYQGGASGGPARKYYRLTPAGEVRLAALLEEWRALRAAMDALDIR